MTLNLPVVMDAFRGFMRRSRKAIVMQHRVPESTISFYMDCMGITLTDDAVVRRKVVSPVALHPMKVLTKHNGCNLLAGTLISEYVKHFDTEERRSSMPIVVFTTRADHAALLLSMLRTTAKDRFGADAEGRIKAVWAGIQGDDWVKVFLARPNANVDDVDVLVTTTHITKGLACPTFEYLRNILHVNTKPLRLDDNKQN